MTEPTVNDRRNQPNADKLAPVDCRTESLRGPRMRRYPRGNLPRPNRTPVGGSRRATFVVGAGPGGSFFAVSRRPEGEGHRLRVTEGGACRYV
jgi:hypothetical protein